MYIFIFLLSGLGIAQDIDSLQVKIDSTSIVLKDFENDFKETYSGTDFNYEESVDGRAENFIARGIDWFFKKIGELFGITLSPETLNFLELITYILLIILAIVLIAKLLSGQNAGALFSRKNSEVSQFNVREEHIERIDFEALMVEAISQNNYRLALRFRFLKLLKQLSQAGHIDWHYEKTNSDYHNEIKKENLKKGFKEASYLYDYVWYGEFSLDETGFNHARERMNRLTKDFTHA